MLLEALNLFREHGRHHFEALFAKLLAFVGVLLDRIHPSHYGRCKTEAAIGTSFYQGCEDNAERGNCGAYACAYINARADIHRLAVDIAAG